MDNYYLPNGKKIDIDGCVMAVLSSEEFPMHFFDTETGNVCVIDSMEALADLAMKTMHSRRYLEITHFDESDYKDIVKDFLDDIIATMGGQSLYDKLNRILIEKGWKSFLVELEKDADGWIHAWSQYIQDEGYDQSVSWLMDIPNVKVIEKFEGCEDCEICKVVKEGNENHGDLAEAFAKQNAKNKLNEKN